MTDAQRHTSTLVLPGVFFDTLLCHSDPAVVAQVFEPGGIEEELLPQTWVFTVLQQPPGQGTITQTHSTHIEHGLAEGSSMLMRDVVFEGNHHQSTLTLQCVVQNRGGPVQ